MWGRFEFNSSNTWWTFRIFFSFSAWGRGRVRGARKGSVSFILKIPRGGGLPGEGAGGGQGTGISRGGGAKGPTYLFGGRGG